MQLKAELKSSLNVCRAGYRLSHLDSQLPISRPTNDVSVYRGLYLCVPRPLRLEPTFSGD